MSRAAFPLVLSIAFAGPALAQQEYVDTRVNPAFLGSFDVEGIKAWAACAWDKLPISSTNLVAYQNREKDAPANEEISSSMATAVEVLNYRINAICGSNLAIRDRNSISPQVKEAKQRILWEARPARVGKQDVFVASFICKTEGEGRTVVSRNLDRPIRDHRINPKISCYRIEEDRSLSDA